MHLRYGGHVDEVEAVYELEGSHTRESTVGFRDRGTGVCSTSQIPRSPRDLKH